MPLAMRITAPCPAGYTSSTVWQAVIYRISTDHGIGRHDVMKLVMGDWEHRLPLCTCDESERGGKSWLACVQAQCTYRHAYFAILPCVPRLQEELRTRHGSSAIGK
jgi:hypothetical protein